MDWPQPSACRSTDGTTAGSTDLGIWGSPALAAELIDYTTEWVAHYKAPRSVDFVDELPRTPTGKLVKGALRDRYRRGIAASAAAPSGR